MNPADWLRRRQAQNQDEASYNSSSYQSYQSFYGQPSGESGQVSTSHIDPKFAYIYKSFRPDKKTKFATHRDEAMRRNARQNVPEFEAERPSFQGAPPPLSDKVKTIVDSRKERYLKMIREPRQAEDLVENYDQRYSNEGMKSSSVSEEEITADLDTLYERVVRMTNITSEERINKLISTVKSALVSLSVQPGEFQQFVERYVSRMINEKKWTSMTVSTAIFLTVASPVKVEEEPANAWFRCIMCKLAYPPGKFACSMCGQTFKSKPDLYVHEFESHGRLFDEHTKCEVCFTMFHKNPSALKAHFRLNHMCQFDHLECMFGCKTLVLETHSRALAEHVYSCHACVECNDLLSGSLDKHLEMFHASPQPLEAQSSSRFANSDLARSLRTEPDILRSSQNVPSSKSKRHLSPSPDDQSNRKRMARDRGTTFEEARSFIDKLFEGNKAEAADMTAITLDYLDQKSSRDNRRLAKNDIVSISSQDSSKMSLEDEINMMFADNQNQSKPAQPFRSRGRSPPEFDVAVYDSKHRERKVDKFNSLSLGAEIRSHKTSSRPYVDLMRKEDSPPNEFYQLEDENANSAYRSRSRISNSNLYAEEMLPRGVVSTNLPVYKDGMYYRGSPPRETSPRLATSLSPVRTRVRARSRSLGTSQKLRSSPRREASPKIAVKYDKYITSPTRVSVRSVKSPGKNEAPKSEMTHCKLCDFSCPANGGYTCRICKQQFLMETKLAIHVRSEHQLKIPIDLKCMFCREELADVRILHNHLLDKHLCSEPHIQCAYKCDMLFTKHNYKIHLETKHERRYCDKCDKDFSITKKTHTCRPKKKPGIDKEALSQMMDEADGVFSDEELKIIEMKGSDEKFVEVKDELVVVPLAPEANAARLNVKKNRVGMANVDLSGATILSGDKEAFKAQGLFYCNSCPLVYNPALKPCSKCDLLFFDTKFLALHAIDVHGCSMDLTDIGCDFCAQVFPSYDAALNHRASHFCKEHVECPHGCQELIVGRNHQLKLHEKDRHSDSSAPRDNNVVYGHVSCDSSKTTQDVLGVSDLTRCSDCSVVIPKGFEIVCDKCSLDNQLKFYSVDELTYHQEKQHKISTKGDFVCTLCKEPQSFKNDLAGLISHRNKKHKLCKNHVKCPRDGCGSLMGKGKLETHLRKDCDFVDQSDLTIRPWFVYSHSEVKVCETCDFGTHASKLYKCPDCNSVSVDKHEFYAHLKLEHKRDELTTDLEFNCLECPGTAAFTVSRWRQHRADKHGYCPNHFTCPNMSCNLLFDSVSTLRRHLRSSTECRNHPSILPSEFLGQKQCTCCVQNKAETVARPCVLCENKNILPFTDNVEYSMHLTFRHNKRIQTGHTIRCDTCKSSFANFADLGNHRIREHRICNKHAFCKRGKKCQFVFHFKETAKNHVCTADSKTRSEFKSSKQSKSGFKEKPKISQKNLWKCADCGFVTNPRPEEFVCKKDKCDKKFVTLNELSAHQVLKHKLTVSGTYQCFICPGSPVFIDAPEKLLEHNSKTHDFCKFHKRCPTPGCLFLFHQDYDITRHLEKCIGISSMAEGFNVKSERSSPSKSLEKESPRKSARVQKSPKKKDEVIDYRQPVPEEGEVEESSKEKSDVEDLSKVINLEGYSLLNCADCSKKFWIDSVLECTLCDEHVSSSEKQFLNRHEMSAHLELKHEVNPVHALQCSMCTEKFLKSSNLMQHVREVHHCCEMHFGCFLPSCLCVFGEMSKLVEHRESSHSDAPQKSEGIDEHPLGVESVSEDSSQKNELLVDTESLDFDEDVLDDVEDALLLHQEEDL